MKRGRKFFTILQKDTRQYLDYAKIIRFMDCRLFAILFQCESMVARIFGKVFGYLKYLHFYKTVSKGHLIILD